MPDTPPADRPSGSSTAPDDGTPGSVASADDRPLFSSPPPVADPQAFLRAGRNPVAGTSRRVGGPDSSGNPGTASPAVGGARAGSPLASGPSAGRSTIAGPAPGALPPPGPAAPPLSGLPGFGAGASTPGKIARAGPAVVVGIVDGRVAVDAERSAARGMWVLAGVVGAALVVAVVVAFRPGRSGLLVSVVLPLAALAVLLGVALWGARGGAEGEPVRRFRVRSVTGGVVACVLRGRLGGDDVRNGDMVRVGGRTARGGHVVVRHVDVLSAPTGPAICRVSARRGARAFLVLWADRLCYVLAVGVAVWVLLAETRLID